MEARRQDRGLSIIEQNKNIMNDQLQSVIGKRVIIGLIRGLHSNGYRVAGTFRNEDQPDTIFFQQVSRSEKSIECFRLWTKQDHGCIYGKMHSESKYMPYECHPWKHNTAATISLCEDTMTSVLHISILRVQWVELEYNLSTRWAYEGYYTEWEPKAIQQSWVQYNLSTTTCVWIQFLRKDYIEFSMSPSKVSKK